MIRQARRRTNRFTPPGSFHPLRIGTSASEKPETTMNTATAMWP